jgi:hypothetical protein
MSVQRIISDYMRTSKDNNTICVLKMHYGEEVKIAMRNIVLQLMKFECEQQIMFLHQY